MNEIYKRLRPKTLGGVIGQDGAVASLERMIQKGGLPHAILLTGPSGVGKTTIARILRNTLDCGERDFVEMNCADFKGIDMVRDIRRHSDMMPLHGECRVWLIDEAHKLTSDAQNAFLKLLEDTPKHVYFMLATTDPHKLIKTIHTRCSEVKLSALSQSDLVKVLQRAVGKESLKVSSDVLQEIAEASDGSARKALVILEQVGGLETEKEQLLAIQTTSIDKDAAINLARELIKPNASWPAVAAILKELKDDPEGIRHLVLSYSRSVMLGGGKLAPRAFRIIDVFSSNFYDSKHAGLAAACWEVVMCG